MTHRRATSCTLAAIAAVLALAGAGATDARRLEMPPATQSTTLATGDFDGDGFADLAAGVPPEDVDGKRNAGAVHVLRGTSSGLLAANSQLWHQGVSGVPGQLETDDLFGRALTAGDFDRDGFEDLAIGTPYEDVDGKRNAGHVTVLYGGAAGLTKARAQGWARNSGGVQGANANHTYFGFALAAADFDGDGRDDLAIGAPGADGDKGAVHVLFGSASGLSASRDLLLRQGRDGVDDTAEGRDWFGGALAAGNLGYSTREADLAIGSPGETVADESGSGAVHVVYGQPGIGPTATTVADVFLHHDTVGVGGDPDAGNWFGTALAVADFGRSTQADLAVGSPGLRTNGTRGSVSVFYGGSYGVSGTDSELWHHGSLTVGTREDVLRFGDSLAAADFNGFSRADLAVGSVSASPHGVMGAGSVVVLYGSPIGLRVTGSIAVKPQLLTRRTFVDVQPRIHDRFSYALAAGNFGNGPGADLAIAAPWVDLGDSALTADAGEVYIGYGQSAGITRKEPAFWNQNTEGVPDFAETSDALGG